MVVYGKPCGCHVVILASSCEVLVNGLLILCMNFYGFFERCLNDILYLREVKKCAEVCAVGLL